MGIFSNRCEALVNPTTGQALTGAALRTAQVEPSWPRCGATVSKSAHYCSVCGAPAPGGWIKCPHCGEWVGNDSQFCWNCNAPLYPDVRAAIANGVWRRDPGVFAQRFEAYDIRSEEGHDLQVQEGTSAILISGGAVEEVLDAGRFNVESTARKINWFGNPPNRSAVLLESGELILPVEVKELPTKAPKEGLAAGSSVDFYGEAVVRFSGGKAAAVALLENAMKGRRELTFNELTDRIKKLLASEVRDYCRQSTLEELLQDAEGREKLRQAMSRCLEDDLLSVGLDLVRLSAAEFMSPEYKELEKKSGELDEKRRQEEYQAAVQAFERDLELKRFRDEHAFLMAKEALEREHRVSEMDRDKAWQLLIRDRADEDLRDQEARRLKQLEIEREYELKKQKIEAEWARRELELHDDEAEAQRKRAMKEARLQAEAEEFRRRQEEERRRFEEAEAERLRQRELLETARREEEVAKARKKAAEEKVRKQKEEEEERIRKWAQLEDDLQHRWKQEDDSFQHNWSSEINKLEHDAEVAAMVQRAAKAKLDSEIDEKRVRFALGLELQGMEGDFNRSELVKNAEVNANVKKVTAGADLDIRKSEHEQDVTEAASGIGLMERRMNVILAQIRDAVERKDEKTAEMLRKQYELMLCAGAD